MAENSGQVKKLSLLSLAFPILIEQILRNLMGTMNTYMLSRISDNASAAVGVANQILSVVNIASFMISTGAAVLINQKLGAGKDDEAAQITMNGLTLAAIIGLVMSFVSFTFSRALVTAMGLQPELVTDAANYLRIVGASCVIQFTSTMIATVFRCHGRALLPMLVILLNNIINVSGSLLVVSDKLPVKGVSGIAAVRLLSEAIGLAVIIVLLTRQKWGLEAKYLVRLKKNYIGKLAGLGFMTGMEGISYSIAQLLTTSFITVLPAAVLSAKVYTQSVNNYAFVVGMAIGQAAQIIAGHMIGAGEYEKARKFIRNAWLGVLGCNLVFSFSFYLFATNIIGLFTKSDEIIQIARTLLMIDIITCCGRSFNHSYSFGLRAAGWVFWPMIIAVSSIWIIQVVVGYFITIPLGLGVIGLWIAQASDEWLRGLINGYLWLSKKWMKKNIVND